MSIVSIIARVTLGLLFTFAGVSVLFMGPPPAMPGPAGALSLALYQSHWTYAVALAQFVSGILLLLNRYVPLALIILGAFLYNSLAFHALTLPATLPVPLVVAFVWILACWPYRSRFAALFTARIARTTLAE